METQLDEPETQPEDYIAVSSQEHRAKQMFHQTQCLFSFFVICVSVSSVISSMGHDRKWNLKNQWLQHNTCFNHQDKNKDLKNQWLQHDTWFNRKDKNKDQKNHWLQHNPYHKQEDKNKMLKTSQWLKHDHREQDQQNHYEQNKPVCLQRKSVLQKESRGFSGGATGFHESRLHTSFVLLCFGNICSGLGSSWCQQIGLEPSVHNKSMRQLYFCDTTSCSIQHVLVCSARLGCHCHRENEVSLYLARAPYENP
jgi:hypothetical protein